MSLRSIIRILGATLALHLCQPAAAEAPASGPALAASVEAVGFTVSDVDRSVEFFSQVLAFEKVSDVEIQGPEHERLAGVFGARMRVVRLRLGDETLELTEYIAPRGRPVPSDTRGNDRWFQHVAIITADMETAYRRLREHGVAHASTGPQLLPDWNRNAGGIQAFYFKDPDGHHLEILAFPPDKGDPRWHRPADRLFLGIDHTAITVRDTEDSLRFYRDALGMKVAGESENYGVEQEHLNNVFGARLRITALRAAGGPGIELLQYLAPPDGRPFPLDRRANDQFHWQTLVRTSDAEAAFRRLAAARASFLSPGPVALPGSPLGHRVGLLATDPDGHAVMLVEK